MLRNQLASNKKLKKLNPSQKIVDTANFADDDDETIVTENCSYNKSNNKVTTNTTTSLTSNESNNTSHTTNINSATHMTYAMRF